VLVKDPLLTQSYDFDLDESFIATVPCEPKDAAKLLVYNRQTDTITHATFNQIDTFLDEKVAVLFNNTKVIKARLYGKKESGGKTELLINRPLPDDLFSVYLKGKMHVGTKLFFDEGLEAEVVQLHDSGTRDVHFLHDGEILDFLALQTFLDKIGHLPLPPYMHREDNKEDETNYQTVFAKDAGAVAAPTASLHFTDELFASFTKKHHHAYITLHVGAGTFKPVEHENITEHPMHSEYYTISDEAKEIIDGDEKLLAVGTTVTRTIEYYVRHNEREGESNLFLHPNNPAQRVDHLLTNFHLPKSTLIMLVASFVGLEKTLELYEVAKSHNYRFYSYGDAMLII
jgi:S-adenosylmethionine:tRNA ribosyltransferase-isomerase